MQKKREKKEKRESVKQVWKPGTLLSPVPAVMVSCRDKAGRENILTVAWTGIICSEPPMAYISVRPERFSYDMIRETGEFVINLTTEALCQAADYCGVRSGAKTDKWKDCGLTPARAHAVEAPLIAESPVNLECRVKQVIPLGSHDLFLAEILCVDVEERFIGESGRLDLSRCKLVAYSHGEYHALGKLLGVQYLLHLGLCALVLLLTVVLRGSALPMVVGILACCGVLMPLYTLVNQWAAALRPGTAFDLTRYTLDGNLSTLTVASDPGDLLRAGVVGAAFVVVCTALAMVVMERRDIK